jgi:signal transduction histidine kinase
MASQQEANRTINLGADGAAEGAADGRTSAEDLLTVLAHDLRNHLTPLQGRLDLIRRRAMKDGRPEYLNDTEHAARNLDRLRRLIGDLLDISRLERGLFRVDVRPLDLAFLLQETAEAFSGGEASIQLRSPGPLLVHADPDRLQQALENLVANAVTHSPPDGVVDIQVSHTTREQQPWVEVRVADQGPGIPPEILPRLFDCFSTGPGSVGLGLGLYLAKRIAMAHGGTLTVDSRPGHGATFVLAWPAHPVEAQ